MSLTRSITSNNELIMFCPNCGSVVNDAKFCPKCGTPLYPQSSNVVQPPRFPDTVSSQPPVFPSSPAQQSMSSSDSVPPVFLNQQSTVAVNRQQQSPTDSTKGQVILEDDLHVAYKIGGDSKSSYGNVRITTSTIKYVSTGLFGMKNKPEMNFEIPVREITAVKHVYPGMMCFVRNNNQIYYLWDQYLITFGGDHFLSWADTEIINALNKARNSVNSTIPSVLEPEFRKKKNIGLIGFVITIIIIILYILF